MKYTGRSEIKKVSFPWWKPIWYNMYLIQHYIRCQTKVCETLQETNIIHSSIMNMLMDTVQNIANIKMPFPTLRVSRWIYFYEYENHTRTLKKQINKKQKQTDKYRKQPDGCQRGWPQGWARWVKGSRRSDLLVLEWLSHRDARHSLWKVVSGTVIVSYRDEQRMTYTEVKSLWN